MLTFRNTVILKRVIRYGMMASVSFLSSFFVLPSLLPEKSRAETGVEAMPSISISPSEVASLNLNPGAFGSASQTVEVMTTNYTGYTLRFETIGVSTDLINSNNDIVIPTISEPLTSSEFVFGYGYSLDGEHYRPVPNISSAGVGDLIDSTNIANSVAISYNLTFGVKVPSDMPAGAYNNQFQLTATPNDVGYFISYDANSEDDDVSDMPYPATQQGQMSGLEVYLSNALPIRPGYVFLGWSENPSATVASYEAGGTFVLDPETENIKTLYAIWDGIGITFDANEGKFSGYWDEELDEWVADYDVNKVVYNDVCQSAAINLYKDNSSAYSMASMTYNIYEAYVLTDFQGNIDEVVALAEPYANNVAELDVMTFPGAEYLEIELLYSVPDEDDMVGIVPGAYFSLEDAMADLDSFVFGDYGTDESVHTWSGQITGDTVTIGIVTDGADGGLGYFAQVRGYDGNGVEVDTHYHISNAPGTDVYLYTDNIDLANIDFVNSRPSSNLIFDTVSFPKAGYITMQQAIWELGGEGRVDVYLGRIGSLEEAASATLLGTFSGSGSDSNIQMPINEFTMVYQSDDDGGYGALVNGYDSNGNRVTGYRLYTSAGDEGLYYCRTKGKYSMPQRSDYRFIGWSENPSASTIDVNIYESQVIRNYAASGRNSPVTLYAVWQRLYSIAYDGNGADEGVMGTPHHNKEFGDNVNLVPSNFSREGYGFAGWNTKADGSGTTYGPNETVTLNDVFVENANADLLIILYALWVPADQNDTLQTFTSSSRCNSMSIGDVLAFTDNRDNDTYAVAKLADGKCWMIENLRLDDSAELSVNNTNNPILPLVNSYRFENRKYVVDEISNHLSVSHDWLCSNGYDYGDSFWCNLTLLDNTNTSNRTTNETVSWWHNLYSYGNYYNTYSALSGNVETTTRYNDSSDNDFDSGSDICPKGWHLPNGSVQGDFGQLINAIGTIQQDGDAALRQFPNNIVPSGYYHDGYISNEGSFGVYWSDSLTYYNTPRTMIAAWYQDYCDEGFTGCNPEFYYNYSGIPQLEYYPSSYNSVGATIRCVAGERYLLEYDMNGGTERLPLIAQEESSFTLSDRRPTRPEYTFLGWASEPNAITVSYQPGDIYIASQAHSILYAVWQPMYEVKYNSNNAESREETHRSKIYEGETFTSPVWYWLSSNDYRFVGWSLNPNAQPGDSFSTIFGPNEPITASSATLGQSVPATITLYAVWVAKDTTYSLQTFASNNRCLVMSQGDIIALQDARDNNLYAVAKLADGKCWMIENLRLEHNETNRNWGDDALSQGFGGDFIGLSDSESSNFDNVVISNVLYNTGNAYTMPRYKNSYYNDYYGNYYSWAAAIADTTPHTVANENVTTSSICPAGWRLPTGGANGDYYNLNYALNNNQNVTNSSVALLSYPANFLFTGYFNKNDELSTHNGYYWTSSSLSNSPQSYAWSFYITKTNLSYTYGIQKYDGLAIRCVVDAQ